MTDRIVYSPAGKPIVAGTDITVEHILRELSYGYRSQDVVANHPELKPAGIRAALLYAADFMALAHMADSLANEASKPKYQPPTEDAPMTARTSDPAVADEHLEPLPLSVTTGVQCADCGYIGLHTNHHRPDDPKGPPCPYRAITPALVAVKREVRPPK